MIAGAFFADLLLNSLYFFFNKTKKLVFWAFLAVFVFLVIAPFFAALNMFLFYPQQVFTAYVNVYFILFPVTIIEIAIGSYIGHKIYNRINKSID